MSKRIELKWTETYEVSVVLNDGLSMSCVLLDRPGATILKAIALDRCAQAIADVLDFVQEINVPDYEVADETATPILVAGTEVGKIVASKRICYSLPKKREKKPEQEPETATTKG